MLKSEKYYRERAAYMREVAKNAQTTKLRDSCLASAEEMDALARLAAREESKDKAG